jgi:hypothetical protein
MNILKRIFKKKTNPNDIITIKNSWDEITVQELMDINTVIEDEDTESNKMQTLISILTGKDFEYLGGLPMVTYKMLMGCTAFLQNKPKPNKLKSKYIINGKTYIQCGDVTKITTAQFVDYNNYIMNNEPDISKILSVILVPEGHDYNQGYNIEEAIEDIKTMRYKDALAISFFLQKQFAAYVMLMVDYSEKLMKESNPTEEQMMKFQAQQQALKNMVLYLLSLESVS